MEKTVAWVAPELREFNGGKGTVFYINLTFTDGESGSLGKQDPDKALTLRNQLAAMVGQPGEFVLEDKGKKNREGKTAWNIKGFPGYEAPTGFGGGFGGGGGTGGGGGGASRRSPESQAVEQRCMNRRTALMQAVIVSKDADEALSIAGAFDTWLNEALPPKQDVAATPSLPSAAASGGTRPLSSSPQPSGGNTGQQGMTWTAPQGEGEAPDSGPSGSVHTHEFSAPNEAGWIVCVTCGEARRFGK